MKTPNIATSVTTMMGIKRIAKQGLTHPFGDARTVKQAFPSGIPTVESDPFLMCDYFDMHENNGPVSHPDEFPVDWHPHRGFDIASYLKTGTGRHGDSLGNRETFSTPGMQWISTGSGVEHAEGGANEKGVFVQGFQIWINVPGKHKMDDPRYGTVPTTDLPLVQLLLEQEEGGGGATARVLAGNALGVQGPFQTVQSVQMIDFELEPNATVSFDIGEGLDTAMLYIYDGLAESVNDDDQQHGPFEAGNIVLFDADSTEKRGMVIKAAEQKGLKAMLFAGKKLKEPVAWHGPIVMNTQEQVRETLNALRTGQFPPKRVEWDYKQLAAFPKTHQAQEL
jgi:redox-sensitive bicupin YhaK (pirin superfamily)